jgi:phage/plasmid-like protein (TIGR03299 family)
MAHELSISNGRAEMAYVGKTPWHGLGQSLAAGADIEAWKEAAGMNWTIESSPVFFDGVGGSSRCWKDQQVLYRSDSSAPLGVVSSAYNIVQPQEVLEFYEDLAGAAGFTLETAGVLFGGKRFWALASIGSTAEIADPSDKMKGYLLLSSSADGSLSTEGRYTHVRVVCNNTLSAARGGNKASYKVSHRSVFNEATAKASLGIDAARSEFDIAMAEFRRMAETPIQPVNALLDVARLFTPGFDAMDKDNKMKLISKPSGPVARVGQLLLNKQAMGSHLEGVKGTAWGWLNAVTEYIDHEGRSRTPDRRLESAWYGPGNQIKERARQMAVEMVNADGTTRTVFQTVAVPEAPIAAPVFEQHGSIDLADILAASPTHG